MSDLTRKQIYLEKGKRKATRRYVSMADRHQRRIVTLERRYQEQLAKDIRERYLTY